jgi:hypothetical protein
VEIVILGVDILACLIGTVIKAARAIVVLDRVKGLRDPLFPQAHIAGTISFPFRGAYLSLALSILGLVGFFLKVFPLGLLVSIISQVLAVFYLGTYWGLTKRGMIIVDIFGLAVAVLGIIIAVTFATLNASSWLQV